MATAGSCFAAFEASRSATTSEEDPVDENGFPIMTHKVVHRIVHREMGGYIEPSINDNVHLENRRWREIRDLDKYTGVSVLHLENNQIGPSIGTGLAHMSKLKALYLQCNMLKHVDSLSANQKLTLLNVATNQISGFTEGGLPHSLNTLLVSANNISTAAAIGDRRCGLPLGDDGCGGDALEDAVRAPMPGSSDERASMAVRSASARSAFELRRSRQLDRRDAAGNESANAGASFELRRPRAPPMSSCSCEWPTEWSRWSTWWTARSSRRLSPSSRRS